MTCFPLGEMCWGHFNVRPPEGEGLADLWLITECEVTAACWHGMFVCTFQVCTCISWHNSWWTQPMILSKCRLRGLDGVQTARGDEPGVLAANTATKRESGSNAWIAGHCVSKKIKSKVLQGNKRKDLELLCKKISLKEWICKMNIMFAT